MVNWSNQGRNWRCAVTSKSEYRKECVQSKESTGRDLLLNPNHGFAKNIAKLNWLLQRG